MKLNWFLIVRRCLSICLLSIHPVSAISKEAKGSNLLEFAARRSHHLPIRTRQQVKQTATLSSASGFEVQGRPCHHPRSCQRRTRKFVWSNLHVCPLDLVSDKRPLVAVRDGLDWTGQFAGRRIPVLRDVIFSTVRATGPACATGGSCYEQSCRHLSCSEAIYV